MTYAEKTSNILERERRRLLGMGAELKLFDDAGSEIGRVRRAFTVTERRNLALGEEYTEVEIADSSVADKTLFAKVVTASLTTGATRFKVGIVEAPKTQAATWKMRLTAFRQET